MSDQTDQDSPEDRSTSQNPQDTGSETVNTGETSISPELDALIRSTLASLDRPEIPHEVAERIHHSLAVESAQRAGIPDATEEPLDELADRRSRKGRWLLAGAGVAAAGVMAVVVTSTSFGPTAQSGNMTAAVVPMSATGTKYSSTGLPTQVGQQLPDWLASSSQPVNDPNSSPPIQSPPTSSTGTADPLPSPSTSRLATSASQSVVFERTRAKITDCLRGAGQASHKPAMVDVATYREPPSSTDDPVAVVAIPMSSTMIDVLVVGIDCTEADPQVRAHIQVAYRLR